MAPVSRPRTSSPHRFSASRHESRRATDKESTGVHGSGSIPSARNSGGRRQRPICGHGRVHASAVLFERGADQRRRRLPFLVGGTAQPQADESLVHAERGRSENLGEPSTRRASIELHLPEPLAAVQEPDGEPRVLDVARVDVRHAVRVKEDLDRRGQAGQAQLPVQTRDRPSQPEPARPGKPNQDNRRQNEQPKGPPGAGGTRARHEIRGGGCRTRPGSRARPNGFKRAPNETSACRLENRSHRIGCWRGHLTPGSCGAPFAVQGPRGYTSARASVVR